MAIAGKLIEHVAEIPRHRRVKLEIVKRSDDVKGFKVVPKRRIVERTFGWLILSRRLIRDYEVKIEHSEAMIYLSIEQADARQNRKLDNFQTAS